MGTILLNVPTRTRRTELRDFLKNQLTPIFRNETMVMFAHRGIAVGIILACACVGIAGLAVAELRTEPAAEQPAADAGTPESGSQVDVLIQQLDHRRPAVRREAIIRLAELGPAAGPAIPRLTDCLRDTDLLVRAHAARAACRIGLAPEAVVPTLIELLHPSQPPACCLAALILGDLGPTARESVPALRSCLAAPAAVVRLHAAEAILKIAAGDDEALRVVLSGLIDQQGDVRYFAVNALGSSGIENARAACAVARAMTDSDTNVAAAAALNLSWMEDSRETGEAPVTAPDAAAPLSPELRQLTAELLHATTATRQAAAIGLAQAGPRARPAADALRARLADRDLIIRVHAARALIAIGLPPESVLPVLVDLLGVEKPNVAVAAAYVLGRIGPPAAAALPSLHDRVVASDLLDRLVLADAIVRIDPTDREALAILTGGLRDPEGDVRYLSAIALGDAPVVHQRLAEKALTCALSDRNLRVQAAAAGAVELLQERAVCARKLEEERRRRPQSVAAAASTSISPAAPAVAPSAPRSAARKPVDVFGPMLVARQAANEARAAAQVATQAAAEARAAARERPVARRVVQPSEEELAQADEDQPVPDAVPAISDPDVEPAIAQAEPPSAAEPPQAPEDHDEGLKPIGQLRATIRMPEGQLPADIAAIHFEEEPIAYQGLGTTRGWRNVSFCWDAPAVFFKPLYFEDINLERYGIHFGWAQGPVSWYCFFQNCLFLPYKLAVQPPCECIYTMGYERPNNCIPLHCFWYCCSSNKRWCKTCPCPIKPPCPWDYSEHTVCTEECPP
jgi:HEAT repeat protein